MNTTTTSKVAHGQRAFARVEILQIGVLGKNVQHGPIDP